MVPPTYTQKTNKSFEFHDKFCISKLLSQINKITGRVGTCQKWCVLILVSFIPGIINNMYNTRHRHDIQNCFWCFEKLNTSGLPESFLREFCIYLLAELHHKILKIKFDMVYYFWWKQTNFEFISKT